jgi:hypothetical protein
MNEIHDVISAFLDDEPFDPNHLAQALSDPGGRALLIDLLALRHLTQPRKHEVFERHAKRGGPRALLAVAAVLAAMVGGYLVGQRQSYASTEAPAATRVVDAAAAWQPLP